MSARDDDFTQVLSRLEAVRDELRSTSSPERVAVLRDLAAELVTDGERLLGVHLDRTSPLVPGGETAPGPRRVDGGGEPVDAAAPAEVGRSAARPSSAVPEGAAAPAATSSAVTAQLTAPPPPR